MMATLLGTHAPAQGAVPTVYRVNRLASLTDLSLRFPGAVVDATGRRLRLPAEAQPLARVRIADTYVRLGFDEAMRCREVFDHIYADFGGPHVVAHGAEAATRTPRRVWRLGPERIVLYCAERPPLGRVVLHVDLSRDHTVQVPDGQGSRR